MSGVRSTNSEHLKMNHKPGDTSIYTLFSATIIGAHSFKGQFETHPRLINSKQNDVHPKFSQVMCLPDRYVLMLKTVPGSGFRVQMFGMLGTRIWIFEVTVNLTIRFVKSSNKMVANKVILTFRHGHYHSVDQKN